MGDGTSEGSIFTIFGATGDLARRKLLPALYRNHASGRLDPRVRILGVSRTDLDDDAFRQRAREALEAIGAKGEELEAFLQRLHYLSSPEGDAEDFARLAQKLQELRSLNLLDRGVSMAGWNLHPELTEQTVAESEGRLLGTKTLEELVASLERPRKIMIMIKAGAPVDSVIGQLQPLLEPGDIVIDGGNSYFEDTRRREKQYAEVRCV